MVIVSTASADRASPMCHAPAWRDRLFDEPWQGDELGHCRGGRWWDMDARRHHWNRPSVRALHFLPIGAWAIGVSLILWSWSMCLHLGWSTIFERNEERSEHSSGCVKQSSSRRAADRRTCE